MIVFTKTTEWMHSLSAATAKLLGLVDEQDGVDWKATQQQQLRHLSKATGKKSEFP